MIFRALNETERAEFRQHAAEQEPEAGNWNVCHPECRAEWTRQGKVPPGCFPVVWVGGGHWEMHPICTVLDRPEADEVDEAVEAVAV